MVQTSQDTANRSIIIGFALQLLGTCDCEDATAFATGRGWLNPDGEPTQEGQVLVNSLAGQIGTRSVFRIC
ncbi:MAG: hypothetical protein AAGK23_10120 [Pseudomonadota bacterium]